LNVIIARLAVSKTPSFIQVFVLLHIGNLDNGYRYLTFLQSLILVFAHLINTQMETVVQFLVSVNIDGRNGLEILLPVWCENHDSFSGFYALKVR
jgi:hypothetical protein